MTPDRSEELRRTIGDVAAKAGVSSRIVETKGGQNVHLLEKGSGPAIVMVHGGGTNAVQWLPLMSALSGVRAIAIDRPGFGLSDPVTYETETFQTTAVDHVVGAMDALGLDSAHVVGNSMGGAWALWTARDHPERVRSVSLLGAVPLVDGASIPFPLRLMATPGLGGLLSRMMTPSRESVVQMMGAFGEAETVASMPEQLDVLVAAGGDPVSDAAGMSEISAIMTPFGFRRTVTLQAEELAAIDVAVRIVLGSSDPIGSERFGRRLAEQLPQAELHMVPGGHMPWLKSTQEVADLLPGTVVGGGATRAA